MQKTPILIVGAGPTGLMMACQLALLHIPFVIIEKESGPTTQSRALAIQARSLEIFSQMGIIDRFLEEGQAAKAFNFAVKGKIVRHIPLSGFGKGQTAYPFVFMLEQSKTEKIFIAFLQKHKQEILWSTELVSFRQDDNGVIANLKNKNGKTEIIHSEYILGTDGAHSVVRHLLGIPLAGKTYKQSLFVLDCKVTSSIPPDEVTITFSPDGFAAFFPMSQGRWRVIGTVPQECYGKEEVTFAEVQQYFPRDNQIKITFSDPAWISLYHSHHRHVASFREGRAFLLGDAAHIHSPVGAQGMNTGLQDAYNLAWKLAFVLQKKARREILDTYNRERLAFAKRLVETTDRVFNIIVNKNPVDEVFKFSLAPKLIQLVITHPLMGAFMFKTISQIGISYHNSLLSEHASYGRFSSSAPKPGDRLPYVLFVNEDGKEINIQDVITPTTFHLIVFGEEEDKYREIIKQYHESIAIHVIPLTHKTASIYKQFGITHQGVYLVRPDMYVGYRSIGLDATHFTRYLDQFLLQ